MARIRSIKPEYFTSDELAQASVVARLLGIGLTTLADRDGRMEDRPMRIRAQVFPYDPEVDCDTLLNELEKARFILRYVVENRHYIQIVNFHKHQQPHPKEKSSSLPQPVEVEFQGQTVASPEKISTSPSVLGSSVYGFLGNGKPASQPKPRRASKLDDPNAQDRAELITLLAEANGPIATPGPQTKAINWLFEVGYSRDECERCFGYLVSQAWRTTAVTWQTVKKEIGAWKGRGEPATENHNGNGNGNGRTRETQSQRNVRLYQESAELLREDDGPASSQEPRSVGASRA